MVTVVSASNSLEMYRVRADGHIFNIHKNVLEVKHKRKAELYTNIQQIYVQFYINYYVYNKIPF